MLDHGDDVIIGSAGDTVLVMTDNLRILKHRHVDYNDYRGQLNLRVPRNDVASFCIQISNK